MFLLLHSPVIHTALLNPSIYKRSLLTNILEMNSSTIKLQKILISNIEPLNLGNDKNLNHYFNTNNSIGSIFRQYWKEYIYITPNNMMSKSFEDIVSRYYLLENANLTNKRKTYIDVKKYLADKKIQVFYSNNSDFTDKPLSIKYTVNKFINRLYTNLLNYSQKFLLRSAPSANLTLLDKQKLPVFIIVNNAHEMIIGEPENILKTQNTFLNSIPRTKLIPKGYQTPAREGYIFINLEDALEYYHYLQSQYLHSFNEMNVKIFVGTLKDFYRQSNLHINNIQLRLLPDLKEVGKLVTRYQYNSNIRFNPKQTYGKHYFQGQPIYQIDPTMCIYTDKLTGKVHKRYFPNLLSLDKKEYLNIFTTYKDAMSVWKKYKKKFPEYILPKNPKLIVYNLESFLRDYQTSLSEMKESSKIFRLVPSYEVYQYIKHVPKSKRSIFLKNISFSAKSVTLTKMWINRIIWGMFKWYPPEQ